MAPTNRPPLHDVPADRSTQAPPWVLGSEWDGLGVRQLGWVLLPLRAFLGFTFVYAGLQKFASPSFFDASSPTSVQHQMAMVAPTSPIGFLVRLSLHAGILVGVLIALAELAIGVATLLGLKARLAAVGGALLALTFFLTMSWTTSPYYYGADIVFLFAWTPFVFVGSAGVLSVDAWLLDRAHGGAGGRAAEWADEDARARQRRTVLLAGTGTVLAAGLTAFFGRMASASAGSRSLQAASPHTPKPSPHHPSNRRTHQQQSAQQSAQPTPSGTRIGPAKGVPVGQAGQFTDPASGSPAWLVRLSPQRCVAFSAICTHAGCTVGYQASNQEFVCPCHGGTYSARTGRVLAGPPPAPLRQIPARIDGGQIYVD